VYVSSGGGIIVIIKGVKGVKVIKVVIKVNPLAVSAGTRESRWLQWHHLQSRSVHTMQKR
jgi:hypothetical protein